MPPVNKKQLARNRNLAQTKKLGLEKTMKGFNDRKTLKIKMKLPHVNKKLARKRIFVCSLYFKIWAKKITPQNHSLFAPLSVSSWPKSLLQFDFNNHENVWTDLKKRQLPNTIQILWIVKKNKRRPIIAPAIAVRLRFFFKNEQAYVTKKQELWNEMTCFNWRLFSNQWGLPIMRLRVKTKKLRKSRKTLKMQCQIHKKHWLWTKTIQSIRLTPIRSIRLPENSRNSFADLQSRKTATTDHKKLSCSLKTDMLNFDLKSA